MGGQVLEPNHCIKLKRQGSRFIARAIDHDGSGAEVHLTVRLALRRGDLKKSGHRDQRKDPLTPLYKPPFALAKPKQTRADLSQARAVEEIYVGSYPVVPASQFVRVGHFVGQRIELIGKVVDVRSGKTSFGSSPVLRPYIYLDFLPIAQGKVVRVKVLPEVIESHWGDRKLLPHDGWVGRWVTVSDVVQPVRYINHPAFASGVGEASLHVDHLSQIREIPEAEARFRLAGQNKLVRARVQTRASTQALPVPTHSMPAPVVPAAPSVAQTTLAEPQSKDPDGVVRPAMRSSVDSSARNRAILEKMRSSK